MYWLSEPGSVCLAGKVKKKAADSHPHLDYLVSELISLRLNITSISSVRDHVP